MPYRTAPPLALSARVRQMLEEIARQRSTEYRLVVRASLLLAMTAGVGNHALTRTHKLDRGTIRAWRTRWLAWTPHLTRAEAAARPDDDLRALVVQGLRDLPRSGKPPTFTAEQIVQIMAVACEAPAQSARPISHWSPAELADEVVKRQLVKSISASSVERFFKSGRPETASD
jgi:putative transposase